MEQRHIFQNNDPEFLEMLVEKGLNAEMITQPVNSPETNLLDLVFQVVQSANDEASVGEGEMIEHIKKTYMEYPRHKTNQTWLPLMTCLNCIIDSLAGGNDYKFPHMNKERMECKGTLSVVLKVTEAAAYMMELMNEDYANDIETNT